MPSRKITVRFDETEAREIQQSARAAGLSVSDFLRRAVYKSGPDLDSLTNAIRAELRQGFDSIIRRLDADSEARAVQAGEQKDSLVKAVNYLSEKLAGGRK